MYLCGTIWRPVCQLSFGFDINAGDTNNNWLYFNDSTFAIKGELKYSWHLLDEISFEWTDTKYETFLNFCKAFIGRFPNIETYKKYRTPIVEEKFKNKSK